MSSEAVGWAFKWSPYKGAQLVVHLALADVANDMFENELWMTLATISKKARCGRSTTSATLATMVKDGYLTLLTDGGGRGSAARYRFEFPDQTIQKMDGSPVGNSPIREPKQSNPRAETVQSTGVTHIQTQEKPKGNPKGVAIVPIDPAPRKHRELCERLRDAMIANGCKPPTITKRWTDAARLMVERDGRTYRQIAECIDWCQNDEFWRTNIHSMPTLRERYDRLRMEKDRKQMTNKSKAHPLDGARDAAREMGVG